jgi:ubiquinone/menaquinone biosynthesis C-methylase UbiE
MHHSTGHRHSADAATEGKLIRWANYYDLIVRLMSRGRERAIREETIQLGALQSGMTVLEVGCGTGTLALLAQKTVSSGQVYGIDPSAAMIRVAQAKAARQGRSVDFRVSAIEALPFNDATFDVVFASLMIHHLPDSLKQPGLAEVYRVMKPGGRLVIVDMKPPKQPERQASLLDRMGQASGLYELRSLLEPLGYTNFQTGDLRSWKVLGYIRGQRPA